MASPAAQPPPTSTTPSSLSAAQPPPTTRSSSSDPYTYPPIYAFPPFFTLQPNPTTRASQLNSWSTHIQAYARAHRLFALSLVDALPTPLFTNTAISRSLSLRDARTVLSWMATPEGSNRAEWINPGKKADDGGGGAGAGAGGGGAGKVWIYWRRPEEWAALLEEWVDRTAQKGSVVTLYEITESDATRREEFWGMDAELLAKSLAVCVKRGKAQIFGGEGSEGVKFF